MGAADEPASGENRGGMVVVEIKRTAPSFQFVVVPKKMDDKWRTADLTEANENILFW